jgi:hypothetical protein
VRRGQFAAAEVSEHGREDSHDVAPEVGQHGRQRGPCC